MLIVCPSCSSRYELDAAKLGALGRKVRCASCRTLWHVEAPPEFPEMPSEDETRALLQEEIERAAVIDEQITALAAESESESALEEQSEAELITPPLPPERSGKSPRGKGLGRGLSAARAAARPMQRLRLPLALTLGGVAIAGILLWQRDNAVRAAPQLAGLFETLGLPVNIRGLSLSAVESGVVEDGLGRFLVVEGDITNITRRDAPVPSIEVAVKDASGQTLYTWSTTPPKPSLEPSELIRFRARLATPPDTGRSVQVRFVSARPTGLASAH